MRMRSEDDHRAMLEAGKAWLRIKKSGQRNWIDWTTVIGPPLVSARHEAMAIAGTNQPKGRGYSEAFSALLVEYRLDDIEQVARKDLFDIMEHLSAVERRRDKQRMPELLNHPTTVWRKFKGTGDFTAEQMARGEYKPKPDKVPPREKPTLLEENVTLRERVRDLEGRITEVEEERDQVREAHSVAPAPADATEQAPVDVIVAALVTLMLNIVNSQTTARELAHRLANSDAIDSLDLIELSKWLKSASADVKRLKRSETAKGITKEGSDEPGV